MWKAFRHFFCSNDIEPKMPIHAKLFTCENETLVAVNSVTWINI